MQSDLELFCLIPVWSCHILFASVIWIWHPLSSADNFCGLLKIMVTVCTPIRLTDWLCFVRVYQQSTHLFEKLPSMQWVKLNELIKLKSKSSGTYLNSFLNPFMTNVFSHPYQVDESISNFRVVGWYFSFLFKF